MSQWWANKPAFFGLQIRAAVFVMRPLRSQIKQTCHVIGLITILTPDVALFSVISVKYLIWDLILNSAVWVTCTDVHQAGLFLLAWTAAFFSPFAACHERTRRVIKICPHSLFSYTSTLYVTALLFAESVSINNNNYIEEKFNIANHRTSQRATAIRLYSRRNKFILCGTSHRLTALDNL